MGVETRLRTALQNRDWLRKQRNWLRTGYHYLPPWVISKTWVFCMGGASREVGRGKKRGGKGGLTNQISKILGPMKFSNFSDRWMRPMKAAIEIHTEYQPLFEKILTDLIGQITLTTSFFPPLPHAKNPCFQDNSGRGIVEIQSGGFHPGVA